VLILDDFIFQAMIVCLVLAIFTVFYLQHKDLQDFHKRIKADEEMLFRLADSITQNGKDILQLQNGKDILQLHGEFNERLKILEERKKPGRKKKEAV